MTVKIFSSIFGVEFVSTNNGAKKALNPIAVAQHRAIKTILHLKARTPSSLFYQETKLFTIEEVYQYQILIFMYKYCNKLLPTAFVNFYTERSHVIKRNIPESNSSCIPKHTMLECTIYITMKKDYG